MNPLQRIWIVAVSVAIELLAAAILFFASSQTPVAAEEPAAFDMKEAPALAAGHDLSGAAAVIRGQPAACETKPNEQVKTYPKLNSEKPYYGTIVFGRDYHDPESGVEFHFVIDGSDKAPEEQPPVSLFEALSGAGTSETRRPQPQVDKKNVTTYDRLYFDVNRDLDLTNDPVLVPMKNPPPMAMTPMTKQRVLFPCLEVAFDRGPELGAGPVRVVPRLVISELGGVEHSVIDFIAASVRKGRIWLGSQEYDAVMSQQFIVSGRFDRQWTSLFLTPVGGLREFGSDGYALEMLSTMHHVNGKYYILSTTPAGDRLFVKLCDGEMGEFRIGPDGRDVQEFSYAGAFRSRDQFLPVGERLSSGTKSAGSFSLPVGDYCPEYSTIQFGPLQISLSNNYHLDGQPHERTSEPPVYGIKIRKDEPFVLDFSTEPEVLFANPAKDATFAPGDTVDVYAVLIDPKLDIMIRRLYRTGPGQEATDGSSTDVATSHSIPESLDPDVVITDASGNEVGGGKLPFG